MPNGADGIIKEKKNNKILNDLKFVIQVAMLFDLDFGIRILLGLDFELYEP